MEAIAVGCWLLAVGCWLLAVGCWAVWLFCWGLTGLSDRIVVTGPPRDCTLNTAEGVGLIQSYIPIRFSHNVF